MKAKDRRNVRDHAVLVWRRSPFIMAVTLALALDYLFYLHAGMSWLSFVLLPVWYVGPVIAVCVLLVVVPPAALSLVFIAGDLAARLLGLARGRRRLRAI